MFQRKSFQIKGIMLTDKNLEWVLRVVSKQYE